MVPILCGRTASGRSDPVKPAFQKPSEIAACRRGRLRCRAPAAPEPHRKLRALIPGRPAVAGAIPLSRPTIRHGGAPHEPGRAPRRPGREVRPGPLPSGGGLYGPGAYSLTAFAGEIGVSRAKLDEWTVSHPPFAEAVARGRAARTRTLEAGLLAAETGAKVSAHRLALRTVQSDDWRDRPEPERHVRPTAPIAGLDLPDNGRG